MQKTISTATLAGAKVMVIALHDIREARSVPGDLYMPLVMRKTFLQSNSNSPECVPNRQRTWELPKGALLPEESAVDAGLRILAAQTGITFNHVPSMHVQYVPDVHAYAVIYYIRLPDFPLLRPGAQQANVNMLLLDPPEYRDNLTFRSFNFSMRKRFGCRCLRNVRFGFKVLDEYLREHGYTTGFQTRNDERRTPLRTDGRLQIRNVTRDLPYDPCSAPEGAQLTECRIEYEDNGYDYVDIHMVYKPYLLYKKRELPEELSETYDADDESAPPAKAQRVLLNKMSPSDMRACLKLQQQQLRKQAQELERLRDFN